MADRDSAELFGEIFKFLAEDPTEKNLSAAKKFWKMAKNYDFRDYQMYVDDELIKLGLAKFGVDPEYPGDEEVLIYAESDGKFR